MERMANDLMKAGDLAKLAGVGVQTLHYYERLGLLPKPKRSPANYRVYSTESLRRVQFIKKAQAVGFTLEEVRTILSSQQAGAVRCHRVTELAEERLLALDKQLATLQAFRNSLSEALPKWKRDALPRQECAGEFCDLIEMLPLNLTHDVDFKPMTPGDRNL